VILARSAVDLDLPGASCTLEGLLAALAAAEPRIARYLRGEDGRAPTSLRPLLNDQLLEPSTPIPDGATVTFLYAVAGGCV
jgi:sulfur transfer ThiS family protein